MDKKVFSIYKLPLLIGLTLSIALIALGTIRSFTDIFFVLMGSLIGSVILDAEYILYAYILEPKKDFSKTLVAFFAHKDFTNAFKYIDYHKDEIKEKSLNSALFQIILACMAIFVISSTKLVFAEALVLALFASSIYKLVESYFKGETDEWFWIFKNKPEKQKVLYYIGAMILVLCYSLYIF